MFDSTLTIFFVSSFAILLLSLSVHEAAHAWTADRLGDPTPRRHGRLTLNPASHIDPIGTLLLPILAFASGAPIIGWARPVPVGVGYLSRGRRDFVLVALAGPVSNVLLALAASIGLRLAVGPDLGTGILSTAGLLELAVQLNLLLAVFNMLPVPPLDGANVVSGLLPAPAADGFDRLRPYGFLVLYALLLTGTLGTLIGPPYRLLIWLLR